MDREVDVLVVGAGPTGSTAAKYAALGGAEVLLIEKRSEIGTPVRCGEGVAKRWLEEIGLTPSREFICHEVDGARVIAPDGTTLVLDETRAGNECGYVLERDLFDRFLAREAAKAGADIMIKTSAVDLLRQDGQVVGARCEHMGDTFDVHADVVIGADGFESQVGRWAGLETHLRTRDIDACLQYTLVGVDGDPRLNDFYLGSCAPGGYAWVFWKEADVANVGIGVNLSKIRDRADAKRYLDALIERTPSLARGEIVEEVAGAVSVSLPLERTVAPGVMLAGDAARLIDPLTGGGILNGCLSGKSRRKLRSSTRPKTSSRPTRGGGGPAWKRSLPGTISSRNASSAWTMRRSTRSSGPCPTSTFNGFRRRASSMRFATGTPRSSKPSTAYCETPSYPNHTAASPSKDLLRPRTPFEPGCRSPRIRR